MLVVEPVVAVEADVVDGDVDSVESGDAPVAVVVSVDPSAVSSPTVTVVGPDPVSADEPIEVDSGASSARATGVVELVDPSPDTSTV